VLKVGVIATAGGALTALALMLAPATAATSQQKKTRPAASLRTGSFTPAVADPGLAAELARRGLASTNLRFTPSSAANGRNKSVRVAVRARAAKPGQTGRVLAETSATPVTAITPTAYNLGASVGWKRFAISGDVAEVKGGALPGGRRNAEATVSYSGSRFTGRVEVGAEEAEGPRSRIIPVDSRYSVGVGGSYRIARNLDVTGGVRYNVQRDRLAPLADDRQDSQAVYIGTAFRF
jgi:hypothetical protein